MKEKKIIAVLLIMILSMSLFSSCTRVETGTRDSGANLSGSKSDVTTTETGAETSNFNETGLPIVKEKVTFDVWACTTASDPEKFPTNIMISEATNVYPNWICISPASLEERKNLMWASGDYPDVLGPSCVSKTDVNRYGPMGILLPLNDLLDKYAVQLKKYATEDVYVRMKSNDGNIYFIPTLSENASWDRGYSINQTWLDALGLEMPDTLDSFLEVMRAFKTQDPNGNGLSDEIPFSIAPYDTVFNMWPGFFGSFGLPGGYQIDENGKVINGYLYDSFKEGLIFLRDMYTEGLLDKETFTIDSATYNARGKSDPTVYGCFLGYISYLHVGQQNEEHFETMPLLKGKSGDPKWIVKDRNPIAITYQMAITKSCKVPEVVVRWADYMMDPYISVQIDRAPIGIYYEDGVTWKIKETVPEGYASWSEWLPANRFQQLPRIITPDAQKAMGIPPQNRERILYERANRDKLYLPYAVQEFPASITPTFEESEELVRYNTDINKYLHETVARWISGNGDIEGEWGTYLSTMEDLGALKVLEIMQKQYDRYLTLLD